MTPFKYQLLKNISTYLLAPLFLLSPLMSKAEIPDSELRKLFIILEVFAEKPKNVEYGGVVLFKNFFTIHGPSACNFKEDNPNTIIFTDQEGGSVVRIENASPPSPLQARKISNDSFYKAVNESARKLKASCIDVNLAPVVELDRWNGDNRYYAKTIDGVIEKASIFSKAMQDGGVKTVLKHFPGWRKHCASTDNLDSIGLKVKSGSESATCTMDSNLGLGANFGVDFESLVAFKRVPSNAWMVGNNIYRELGPYPSSMNPKIRDIIRNGLNYDGLLISDALWEIEATPKTIVMALQVNDLVMVGFPSQVEISLPEIRNAIKRGIISEKDILDKIKRLKIFKKQ